MGVSTGRTDAFGGVLNESPLKQKVTDLIDSAGDKLTPTMRYTLQNWSIIAGRNVQGHWDGTGLWATDTKVVEKDLEEWFRAAVVESAPSEILEGLQLDADSGCGLWWCTNACFRQITEVITRFGEKEVEHPDNKPRLIQLSQKQDVLRKLLQCWSALDVRIPMSIVGKFNLLANNAWELEILSGIVHRNFWGSISWIDTIRILEIVTPDVMRKFADTFAALEGVDCSRQRIRKLMQSFADENLAGLAVVALPDSRRAFMNLWNSTMIYLMGLE